MKNLHLAASALIVALSVVGCMTEEPITATQPTPIPVDGAVTPLPETLRMNDTLSAAAPIASLTGTWNVRQVNKNGALFLGTASFLQVGRLLVGRIDWQGHPDGYIIGWAGEDVTAFGQGFTDTSKANLLGYYAARIASDGDSLVEGTTYSNRADSGIWVAARVSDCPVQILTPEPLPCQSPVTLPHPTDTVPLPADTLPHPADTVPLPADTLPHPVDTLPQPADTGIVSSDDFAKLFDGCWAVSQVNLSGSSYRGTFLLEVQGKTVSGTAMWVNHPSGVLSGSAVLIAAAAATAPDTLQLAFVQSFTGEKAGLKGHYNGTLRPDSTLSGTTYATENGVATGDRATWTASRVSCSLI